MIQSCELGLGQKKRPWLVMLCIQVLLGVCCVSVPVAQAQRWETDVSGIVAARIEAERAWAAKDASLRWMLCKSPITRSQSPSQSQTSSEQQRANLRWTDPDPPGRGAFTRDSNQTSEAACKLLLERLPRPGVLFVGDSLSRLHTNSLAAFLGAVPARNWKWPRVYGAQAVNIYDACGGRLRIGFVRNDWLDTQLEYDGTQSDRGYACAGTDKGSDSHYRNAYCEPWAFEELLAPFGAVVLNSGAHVQNDQNFADRMRAAAKATLSLVPKCTALVYRATVPGHSHCSATSRPFVSLREAEASVALQPWHDGDKFQPQNLKARAIFTTTGFTYLDAYTPTVQRPDFHVNERDCLHYCIGGPPDVWVDLLLDIIGSPNPSCPSHSSPTP